MSRVFSWQQIQLKQLPTGNRPHIAKEMIINGLLLLVDQEIISGARIVGSLARGKTTVQSDADVVVGLRSNDAYQRLSLLGRNVEEQTFLPVTYTYVDPHQPNIPKGDLWLFRKNPPDGNIVEVDPVTMIGPLNISWATTLSRYFNERLGVLSGKMPSLATPDFYKLAGQILSTPTNLAKTIVGGLNLDEFLTPDGGLDFKKFTTLLSQLNPEVSILYTNLLAEQQRYSQILGQAINHEISQGEYFSDVIRIFHKTRPIAESFLTSCQENLPVFIDPETYSVRRFGKEI